jgi:hypothetical protein
LAPWASRRREDLLKLLDVLNPTIAERTETIDQEVSTKQSEHALFGGDHLTGTASALTRCHWWASTNEPYPLVIGKSSKPGTRA